MSGRIDFEYGFNTNSDKPIEKGAPMRMYFLGDFIGKDQISNDTLTNKIVKIDIDNFDDVMTRLSPSVTLPSGHQIIFNELEDFHPDILIEHDVFKKIRRLRRELSNATTADCAANEIIKTYQIGAEITSEKASEESEEANVDMFERLLGAKQSTNVEANTIKSTAQKEGNLERFLSEILSNSIVKDTKT